MATFGKFKAKAPVPNGAAEAVVGTTPQVAEPTG